MRVYYNAENVCVQIPIDYCDKEAMKELGKILFLSLNDTHWLVQGLYLNHALEEDDILLALSKLEILYYKKDRKMNVSLVKGIFEKDDILLNTEEMIEYFADFAVFYMEITIWSNNDHFVKIGTDSDANGVYICISKNESQHVQSIIKGIGILKLSDIRIDSFHHSWRDIKFDKLLLEYPVIKNLLVAKLQKKRNEGWINKDAYTTANYLKKIKKLVFIFYNAVGERLEISMLELRWYPLNYAIEIRCAME